jgi:hypothetical protein
MQVVRCPKAVPLIGEHRVFDDMYSLTHENVIDLVTRLQLFESAECRVAAEVTVPACVSRVNQTDERISVLQCRVGLVVFSKAIFVRIRAALSTRAF